MGEQPAGKMWCCALVALALYKSILFVFLSESEWYSKDEIRILGDEMGGEAGEDLGK